MKNNIWKIEGLQLTDEEIDEVVRYFQNKRENKDYVLIDENKELEWNDKEIDELEKRILNLRDDQIGALCGGLGVEFSSPDKVAEDIRKYGKNSVNFDVLISESESKESLIWWLDYFEKYNKNNIKI